LEEALSKSDQQLENVLKERDDVFASNKQLTEAFTKSVQQFEKERDDLAASKKQLEEAALKRQIQTDNQAKKVWILMYNLCFTI
jgi:peptidoglycan hydrolase CwlO-like protein